MTQLVKYIYWTKIEVPNNTWCLYLAATDEGLCLVTLPSETFDTVKSFAKKYVPDAILLQDDIKLTPYSQQIIEYFGGKRKKFNFSLDLKGTPFQRQVWEALWEIPFGQTQSYSAIAKRIGRPTAVRAVGAANGENPLPIVIPCHRVIGKNGTLTGYRGGIDIKKDLLQLEGLVGE